MNSRSTLPPDAPDLGCRDDGLFTLFLPNTKAGEDAWRTLAEHTEGTGKVFSHQAQDVIRQLRAQGYTVGRLPEHSTTPAEADALFAELMGTPQQR